MATYAIGDVQGCYDELCALLDDIGFEPAADRLWFVGDLVNRGPKSLDVLRLAVSLGDAASTVLGNHDLHLIAAANGRVGPRSRDTLDAILDAEDRDALLGWLRNSPVFHTDDALGVSLVHAGLAPPWTIADAQRLARELEACLRGPGCEDFLAEMYGNEPDRWSDSLEGPARLRIITNAFTRIRYCRGDGSLVVDEKRPPQEAPPGLYPWYAHPDRRSRGTPIVFGHWAALQMSEAEEDAHGVYHIDHGCVWGGRLTALRLEDMRRFSVDSRQPRRV